MLQWLWVILTFLVGFAKAQEDAKRAPLPLRLTLSSWMGEHHLLPGVNLSETTLRSRALTYYDFREARLTRLDERRIRVELERPIEVSLFADESGPLLSERRFRSFVIESSPTKLNHLMDMVDSRYLAMDWRGDHLLEGIDEIQTRGRDAILRDIRLNRIQFPNVQELAFIHLTVHIEHLGRPEGAPVEHFGLGTYDRYNPSRPVFALGDTNLKGLDQLYRVFKKSERPMVEAYLHEMLELMDRREELRARGWLEMIYRGERTQAVPESLPPTDSGIVPFAPRCHRVFALPAS